MSKVIDSVRPVVETIIDEHGDMLVDMEYVKEKGQNYLRIYVDRQPNGIDNLINVNTVWFAININA